MPAVPGLRSPYEKIGGLYYFPRMIDKVRLHAKSALPKEYIPYLGAKTGFDGRCCRFLDIDYAAFAREVKRGGADETILQWAFTHGRKPSTEEIEIWNAFMAKRGWRDKGTEPLLRRLREGGFPLHAAKTSFDYIDLDEGRPAKFPAA